MAERRKVRPDCVYASNPFHECTDYCLKKTAESKLQKEKKQSGSFILDLSRSFGRKKGSRPKPPKGLDIGSISSTVSSEAQSPIAYVSPRKKSESRNGNHITSKPPSDEIIDLSLSADKFESFQPVPTSVNVKVPANPKDTSNDSNTSNTTATPKEDKKNDQIPVAKSNGEGVTAPTGGSSFSFLGIAQTLSDNDEEEVESVTSESNVSVGKYRVKSSFSSILQSVFDKYGDIAATCKLESISMRSYYLECVCYVIQELQCTQFKQFTKSKVRELTAILKDVESSQIDVSWLRSTLEEIAEAVELSSQRKVIEAAKVNCDRDLELTKKELELQLEDLALKEKEVADAMVRVEETKARLSELEIKSSQLHEIDVSNMSKIDGILV